MLNQVSEILLGIWCDKIKRVLNVEGVRVSVSEVVSCEVQGDGRHDVLQVTSMSYTLTCSFLTYVEWK